MNLVWKGKLSEDNQLPTTEIPTDAVWIFVPKKHATFSTALFVCGISMFGSCTVAIANAIRAIREMPRGSFLQTSGLKVYWFTREDTR